MCVVTAFNCLYILCDRNKVQECKLDAVLEQVRDHAADRDAWDMADECKLL